MLTYPGIRFCNRSPEECTDTKITQRFPRYLLGPSGTSLALINHLQVKTYLGLLALALILLLGVVLLE